MGRIYTLEDARAAARRRNGECLSTEYRNATEKMEWQCEKGHRWKAPFYRIVKKGWCKRCAAAKTGAELRVCTLADFQEIARRQGGQCLATEYQNVRQRMSWRCEKGHTWTAEAGEVRRGTWCPKCAAVDVGIRRRKYTIDDMRKLATTRGGAGAKCLSAEYQHNHHPMEWQCAKGHTWTAEAGHIISGSWCSVCAFAALGESLRVYTIVDMQRIATERGGSCLSTEYKSVHTKLSWKCAEGHEWNAAPTNVMNGTWCVKCARKKHGERQRLLHGYTIADMQELANAHGGRCLSGEYDKVTVSLKWQCAEGHCWDTKPTVILGGSWCPRCGVERSRKKQLGYSIEDFHALAESRGGKCLSTEYVNVFGDLRWSCAEGHTWVANASNIMRGRWCPKCSYATAGLRRRKYTLQDMCDLAAKNGGECLSQTFGVITELVRWRCSRGHEFQSSGSNVLQGRWCARCSRMRVRIANIRRQVRTMQAGTKSETA